MTANIKVRKKRSKKVSSTDMQMLSVLSNSETVYYDWDKERIVKSLVKETDCDEALAREIADSVEQSVAKSGRTSISSDIIRAMVNEELFNRGKTKILEKQGIYSISRHDIEQLIFSKSNDNSNITKNTPGVVAITIAEILLKRYALDVIFSDDVKEAHLRGEIYLHDLGQSPTKVYCGSHSMAAILKNGLNLQNMTNTSAPAKSALVLIGHLNTFLSLYSGFWAGALGVADVNTVIAPLLVGMEYKEIKQIAQYLFFSFAQNCFSRNGGEVLFIDLNFYSGITPHLRDVKAIGPGGVMLDKTYGDFENEARLFTKAALEITKEGDSKGKLMAFPKCFDKDTKLLIRHEDGIEFSTVGGVMDMIDDGRTVQLPAPKWRNDRVTGVVWADVKGAVYRGVEDGLCVELSNNIKMVTTKDHHYYVWNGTCIAEKEAKDLVIDDIMLCVVPLCVADDLADGQTSSIVPELVKSITPHMVDAVAIEMDNEHHDFVTGDGIITKNCQFHIRQETFDNPDDLAVLEYACEVAAHNGNVYFNFDRSAVQLSACCFSPDTNAIIKLPDGVVVTGTFEKLYELCANWGYNSICVLRRGKWVKASIIQTNRGGRKMFDIHLHNGDVLCVTDDHIFPTVNGDKFARDLTNEDMLIGDRYTKDGTIDVGMESPYWVTEVCESEEKPDWVYCFEMEDKSDPYFTLPNGVISHNCRLTEKVTDPELIKNPDRIRFTGVCNTTVNLPQVGYRSGKDAKKMYAELERSVGLAIKATLQRKAYLKKLVGVSGSPLEQIGKPFYDGKPYVDLDNATYIVGIVGMNELVKYMTGEELHESVNALKFGLEVMSYFYFMLKEAGEKHHMKFVAEESPVENCNNRLCQCDRKYYPESMEYMHGQNGAYYYTNSVHLRPDCNADIIERIQKQALFSPMFEAGTVVHCFVGENAPSPKAILSLLKKTWDLTNCKQLTISPELTYCNVCGAAMLGLKNKCPNCGAEDVSMERVALGKNTSSEEIKKKFDQWAKELEVLHE